MDAFHGKMPDWEPTEDATKAGENKPLTTRHAASRAFECYLVAHRLRRMSGKGIAKDEWKGMSSDAKAPYYEQAGMKK